MKKSMKKPNHVTYYCALMLWELYILDNAVGDIITSPIKYQYAFLYDRCRWIRKMLEKQGFTSSDDVRIRFDSWAKSQDKNILKSMNTQCIVISLTPTWVFSVYSLCIVPYWSSPIVYLDLILLKR